MEEGSYTHAIYVQTGSQKNAGTNSTVHMKLGDDASNWSEEIQLGSTFRNDFKSGVTDVYYCNLPFMRRVTEISILRDGDDDQSDLWYLVRVMVKDMSGVNTIFPVNRWILANSELKISEFDSSLPFDDKNQKQRREELEKKQEKYKLQEKRPGMPKEIENVPEEEMAQAEELLEKFDDAMSEDIDFDGDFITLADFEKVFDDEKFPAPPSVSRWRDDKEFGRQRLGGVNPVVIKCVNDIPEKFPVTSDMVETTLEGKTLMSAINRERIHLLDLTFLAGFKQMCAPYALLYTTDLGDVIPIAIQLMPEPGEGNPIFLPSDPEFTWLSAKMWVNLADAFVHQSFTNLSLTHQLMELVVVCMNRQLSPSHPIFRLLAPHFHQLLPANHGLLPKFLDVIHKATAISEEKTEALIKQRWQRENFMTDVCFPNNLVSRRSVEVEGLGSYPYRDDACLLWNAIHQYVDSIVQSTYGETEHLLSADHEIQGFARELSQQDGAAMKGVPKEFTTRQQLTSMLTSLIFIATVQQAAINGSQYDEYSFGPNYPTSMKLPRPEDKGPISEANVVLSLPTHSEMTQIMKVTKFLSRKPTETLGQFPEPFAADSVSVEALIKLQNRLREIEKVIKERNSQEPRKSAPYKYLLPSRISNCFGI